MPTPEDYARAQEQSIGRRVAEAAAPPQTVHCPSCGYDLRVLLRPLIREILLELEAMMAEEQQPNPEPAKPPNPRGAPTDSQGRPLF